MTARLLAPHGGSSRASPASTARSAQSTRDRAPLATQHRDLVAQHEQLGVPCHRAPRQQPKPPQHLAEQQIEQSKSHMPIIAAR